jgi:DNA mismatch repair protein MutS
MAENLTPVRAQYLDIKRRHPDAILFFRLGDFYETFDADAEIAARELDIVLTSRNVAKGTRVPMAGIPFHAAEQYLARLLEKGYHVAICEQIGDTPVRGLFPREVVRIVTPGTLVEAGMLRSEANNYLAAVVFDQAEAGIAYVDITTGEFTATQLPREGDGPVRQELGRLAPAEVLFPEGHANGRGLSDHVTSLPTADFDLNESRERLLRHFGAKTLSAFGVESKPLAIRAAGAILAYLARTQAAALPLLVGLSTYSQDEFMTMDGATRRNLELTSSLGTGGVEGSLFGVIDHTVTPMGRRLLRQRIHQPLTRRADIDQRLDQVESLLQDALRRAQLRKAMAGIGDMERCVNRLAARMAGPRDLSALRAHLRALPAVQGPFGSGAPPALEPVLQEVALHSDLLQLLETAIVEEVPPTLAQGGVIRPGFSPALEEVLRSAREARQWIGNLERVERDRTGIRSLKVGFNKVFGYYLEVTKANAASVPAEYIRKQTLVNAERYITPEMKDYESIVMTAEERQKEIEADVFRDLCDRVGQEAAGLLSTARALARLDVAAGLAEVAARLGYVRPQVVEDDVLEIREGRHPVVEERLRESRFVPNDTVFEPGERIRVITGPNMSGKSTYLRQVALLVLLAQMGSFVPARAARLGVTDRIFTRIGAQDEIYAGRSTFMVEMVETAHILHHATRRSLLILDEIGRGTSTYDGLSIAWAVIEHIHNHPRLRSRTLFATHYHELTRLADLLPAVRNYNVAVSEDGGRVVFLHRILPGGADRSYGIHVAELAGLPRPVLHRAREILTMLESDAGRSRGGAPPAHQLSLFPESHPIVDDLRRLEIASLTPLEALNLLYEWQKRDEKEGPDRDG